MNSATSGLIFFTMLFFTEYVLCSNTTQESEKTNAQLVTEIVNPTVQPPVNGKQWCHVSTKLSKAVVIRISSAVHISLKRLLPTLVNALQDRLVLQCLVASQECSLSSYCFMDPC
ncbi:uncharacterized protein LOC133179424 isoform X3 [Saccostrea echinata]|uniref:uncharacterized protein LOC133179424 isoform X3 n=1 Tax=Saccostrea echinata TaxID=191078 RepID=UPI002A8148FA|nr:uncharacterized protein LOC133179424 isoform X3 [Saccostrea echinata]